MVEKEVSYYEAFGLSGQSKNLLDVLSEIKTEAFKVRIDELRSLKNDAKLFEENKKKLPHFTFSGQFSPSRKMADLVKYNPVMILDIDHVGDKAQIIRDQASKIGYTWSAFISPSGEGVKIVIKTASNIDTHEAFYVQLADYYAAKLSVEVDRSGKDITRVCFVSYDPDLYLNEQSNIFQYKSVTPHVEFKTMNVSANPRDLFDYTVDFTSKVVTFHKGNRNNFIYRLANNLNRAGMDESTALGFISSNYTDADMAKQIPGTVKSAYSHIADHATYKPETIQTASSACSATTAIPQSVTQTPLIPLSVYRNLPSLLIRGTEVFDVRREKDVFLTGALAILSSCFNNVNGLYDNRVFHSNIFCFVIAPPASGKGVLNFSRALALRIHSDIKSKYSQAIESGDEHPDSPQTLFIPADSSSAAFKRNLMSNSGTGCICETEADTLTSTFQQDWGGYKDLICKAFHHEPVTFNRIGKPGEDNSGEIENPRLSTCLSGTPIQVPALLKSTGDGLFSRFIFYTFRNSNDPFFKNVFAKDGVQDLKMYFDVLADELFSMYRLVNEKGEIKFRLKEQHEIKFVSMFNVTVKRLVMNYGEETQSLVNRLGLITFRIAMILTILRSIENNCLNTEIECSDIDFETSLALSEVYLAHSLEVFQTLPGSKPVNKTAEFLLESLPNEFQYSEAIKIGKNKCSICERSVANYLKELVVSAKLIQPKQNGGYFKPTLQ